MRRVSLFFLGSFFFLFSLLIGFPASLRAEVTVSGTVSYGGDDNGYTPSRSNLAVRVAGTANSAMVAGDGSFTLNGVPAGTITLLLDENGGDWFTQESKRVPLQVGTEPVSGITISPMYHWQEINYPAVWGQTGYGERNSQFISAEVGFILFRVRGDGIPAERRELYRTLDGGQSWAEIGHWVFDQDLWNAGHWFPSMERIFSFADADTGLILAVNSCGPCGDCGIGFLRTDDGGTNWSATGSLPAPDVSYSRHIDRLAWINSDHLIVAGTTGCAVQGYGSGFYDVVWESLDGGVSWLHQSNGSGLCCHGNDVWAFDPTHAVWKSNDRLFRYTDPPVTDFELLAGVSLVDWYTSADRNGVVAASFKLLNRSASPDVPVTSLAPVDAMVEGRTLFTGLSLFRETFENGISRWQPDELNSPWRLNAETAVNAGHSAATVSRTRDDNNYGARNNLNLKYPLLLSGGGSALRKVGG